MPPFDAKPTSTTRARTASERIADELRGRIGAGALRPGDRLPTQDSLSQEFAASRYEVRSAIETLLREGLVHTAQGRGMFVRGIVVDYWIKSRTRWSEMVRSTNRLVSIKTLGFEEKRGDAEVWRQLAMRRGDRIVEFTLLRMLDNLPLCVATHQLPAVRFPRLSERLESLTSVTDLYVAYGIRDYLRADTTMISRVPTRAECELLQVSRSRPVTVLEGRNMESDGRPLEISRSVWPSDRIRVRI